MSPKILAMLRLGRTRTGRDVSLDPFSSRMLTLTGATRTGKSMMLYVLLYQLLGLPVRVCGIDPSGIVFNALGERLGGSDWRVMTLRDVEEVRRVMTELVAEMDDRIGRLLDAKRDKFDEADFSDSFPLLVVVLEEYPGLLAAVSAIDQANGSKQADRIELKVRAVVQRLALEGAKVGIRLWVVAQRADASLLTGVLRSQLTQRISFRQDADGLRMLHEGITPEEIQAAQTFKPGQGFIEMIGEMPLTMFRADYLPYEEFVERFR